MNEKARLRSGFRLSLREMLVLIAVIAVGCAALKYANPWWVTEISAVTMLAFMAAAIVALVDRGPRQAFAIGFVVCLAIYGALLLSRVESRRPHPEMDPDRGTLPSTQLLRPLFQGTVVHRWIDSTTGDEIPNYDPESQFLSGGLGAGGLAVSAHRTETPYRGHFMPIGHCLWALLLGSLGGFFARFVYARRSAERDDP